jgi:hypothetical protein
MFGERVQEISMMAATSWQTAPYTPPPTELIALAKSKHRALTC